MNYKLEMSLSLGQLDAVINLTAKRTSSAIQLSWQPPFSLNLTTAEPDIVYCVNVFNITDEGMERDHLISNCSVFETYYNFVVENPDPNDLFQLIVTPRSNIEGARSRNTKEINATFIHLVEGKYNTGNIIINNIIIIDTCHL